MRNRHAIGLAAGFITVIALAGQSVETQTRTQTRTETQTQTRTETKSPDPVGYSGTLLVQLAVTDLDRAIAFYRDRVGFELERRDEALRWARIKPGIPGVTIGLGEQAEVTGSGSTSLNFGVADVEAARKVLEARGVEFAGPTVTVPGVVQLADFKDPDGNRIRLAGHPDEE